MELNDVIKILQIAVSCRSRAKMLLVENHYLDEPIFDALIIYTNNVIETIELLSDILEYHFHDLNSHECLEIMEEVKVRIDNSAEIEDHLSKYVSLTVH
tara:strand:+ start:2693 stop:2989 length:297 start_codon:yes stop_codon:yes gene_type:complete